MLLLYVLTIRKVVSVVLISLSVGNDKVIGIIGVGTLYLCDECEIMRIIPMLFSLLKGWHLDPLNSQRVQSRHYLLLASLRACTL